jgi:hypothetical protein
MEKHDFVDKMFFFHYTNIIRLVLQLFVLKENIIRSPYHKLDAIFDKQKGRKSTSNNQQDS